MKFRYRTAVRVLGLLLLVLAVSPVTAPFSTCDLVAILGGGATTAGTSLQPKASPDEPAADVDGAAVAVSVPHRSIPQQLATPADGHGCCTHNLPLRI